MNVKVNVIRQVFQLFVKHNRHHSKHRQLKAPNNVALDYHKRPAKYVLGLSQ